MSETQLVPEIRSAVQGMAKGSVSKAVRSSSGFHVLKLLDTKEASERPLTEVHGQVVNSLRLRKAEANGKQFVNELIKRFPITVNQVELAKLAQPPR